MNPVFRTAAENTQLGGLLGLMTIFFFAFFLVWTWYAYRPANREYFESCGRLPLDDSPAPGGDA